MKGHTNRTKLNVSSTETDVPRVVSAVNRLPFGFVGFGIQRTSTFGASFPNNWEAPAFLSQPLDIDKMVPDDGLSAKIADGCDGVYVVQFTGRMTGGTGIFRVQLNGVTILDPDLDLKLATTCSLPTEMKVGDVLTWQFFVANTANFLGANAKLSIYRVGFMP